MKTQKTIKLTTLEQNASDYVAMRLRLEQPVDFTLVYKKSANYGYCPTVYDFRENKIAYAGGYGYDKHSAAVSQVVRWIFPVGSEENKDLGMLAGVGTNSITEKLAELGWNLERVGTSPVSDSYRVTKLEAK